MIRLFYMLFLIGYSSKIIAQNSNGERVGETVRVKDKNIEWEVFDTESIIGKKEIKTKNLQGLWNAYKGVYRFENHVNAMNLTSPFIIEIKNNTCRRDSESPFEKFNIENNLIIVLTGDTGIINKITNSELTINWKRESNYTRYYYTK